MTGVSRKPKNKWGENQTKSNQTGQDSVAIFGCGPITRKRVGRIGKAGHRCLEQLCATFLLKNRLLGRIMPTEEAEKERMS